jgi:hypothetical protein
VVTKKVTGMEGEKTATSFDEAAYDAWLKREAAKDAARAALYQRLVIENDDPECERVIAALEAAWTQGR